MFCSKEHKEIKVLLQSYTVLEKSKVTLEDRTKHMGVGQTGRKIDWLSGRREGAEAIEVRVSLCGFLGVYGNRTNYFT